jgi:hypothetical protein
MTAGVSEEGRENGPRRATAVAGGGVCLCLSGQTCPEGLHLQAGPAGHAP